MELNQIITFAVDQVLYQFVGVLFQIILLLVNFQIFHKDEMNQKKYNGSASFLTMFKRYLKGRKFETQYTFFTVLIIALTLHITSYFVQFASLLSYIGVTVDYNNQTLIIVLIGAYVVFGKSYLLKKMNDARAIEFGRGSK